jgi:hypothetical protein
MISEPRLVLLALIAAAVGVLSITARTRSIMPKRRRRRP